jgi:hypothetical protein
MAILAMSPMGILPMVFFLHFLLWHKKDNSNSEDTGKMPVIHMGKMPMLHTDYPRFSRYQVIARSRPSSKKTVGR